MKKFYCLNLAIIFTLTFISVVQSANAVLEQELKSLPWSETQSAVKLKGNIKEDVSETKQSSGIGVIGIRFIHQAGYPSFIDQVYPGSPANREGLMPKDLIFAIDGIRTDKLNSDAVYQLLAGKPGSKVRMFISRGKSMFNLEVTREDLTDLSPEVQNRYLSGPIVVPFNFEDILPYQ